MYRPSFRMILFIVALSAGHMAAMAPPKVSTTRLPQESASQPMIRVAGTLCTPHGGGSIGSCQLPQY
jgi:hypothetical protein